jgi:uncharacterized protein
MVQIEPPARFLVTGDTHRDVRRTRLPREVLEAARSVEYIIHTGDFCDRETFETFSSLAPTLAVAGNNDHPELATDLPQFLTVTIGGLRIVVTHGWFERGPSARAAVHNAYAGRSDIVVYGHSHRPEWELQGETWFLNPGSPTMKRREPRHSFANLFVTSSGAFDAEIVYFDFAI